MKHLPGKTDLTMPRWLKTGIAIAITAVTTVWLLSLLPFLLLAALVLSIFLIPVVRRLRRDMEEAGFTVDESFKSDRRRDVNITPWHRQIRNVWRDFNS